MKRVGLAIAFLVVAAALYFAIAPRWGGQTQDAGPSAAAGATAAGNAGKSGKGRSALVARVIVAAAKTEDAPIEKSVVGTMEPIDSVVIRPQVDGIVMAVNVADGQMVKAGDLLFKLDDRAIQATVDKDQAAIAKDQANLDSANLDLAAAQDLAKRQVDTQQQAYQALATVKELEASIAMDKAQLAVDQVQLSQMTISAPIDGRVGVVNTSVGDLVRAADTTNNLVTITRMAPLRVSFIIAERDLPAFRTAMADKPPAVRIVLPGNTDVIATGTLSFIDSSVDTASGTIVLKAEVANADGALWPGQYVNATVELGVRKSATTVPLIAVQQGDGGAFVFVVGQDKTARKQLVTVADTLDDVAVISSGVNAGDNVVVDGQLHLQDGSPVQEAAAPAGRSSVAGGLERPTEEAAR